MGGWEVGCLVFRLPSHTWGRGGGEPGNGVSCMTLARLLGCSFNRLIGSYTQLYGATDMLSNEHSCVAPT